MSDVLELAKSKMDNNPKMASEFLIHFLKSHPDHPEALQLLGLCKLDMKEDATEIFSKLIELDPTAENHANLAICFSRVLDHQGAIRELHKAIAIKKEPLFLSNLAIQYHNSELYNIASYCLEEAIEINESAVLWNNLGCVKNTVREFEYAVHCFQKAVCLDQSYVAAHVNLGINQLILGNWQEGFKEFEWRFWHYPEMEAYLNAYNFKKRWDGKESLKGKKVLIHGEQGLGDIIMFSRFAKELKSHGAYITINTPSCLNSVMKNIIGNRGISIVNCDINDRNQILPEYDFQISSMSLPHLLGLKEIKGNHYIKFKRNKREHGFHVGVIWAGNPQQADDKERSIPFEVFSDLFSVPGVTFHNLSKDIKVDKLVNYEINDFGDTRKILSTVDLVIGCQTAAIHLAGAMGIPTWTLLAYEPDWRWGCNNKNTMWYDCMELFNQRTKGDWADVITRVKSALTQITCSNVS